MLVDFYITDKNLVIECQEDYWHMSSVKYDLNDFNKSTDRIAYEQWEKDRWRKFLWKVKSIKL